MDEWINYWASVWVGRQMVNIYRSCTTTILSLQMNKLKPREVK